MKTLIKLFQDTPSYMKWGTARLAEKTGLKEKTITAFKNKPEFKKLKAEYTSQC